ncbi:hypothetical protein [Micromonospora profundi]|uniref:hypothetical protein n=1 Tax=Micromonospora profundi TaxID=1420889 RepID=UPI0036620518
MHDDTTSGRTCVSDTRCRAYDRLAKPPAAAPVTTTPLCDACLDHHRADIQALPVDYLDLAQLHETSLSQALRDRTTGSHESPLLIAGQVQALQAEIVHATTTWETEVRHAARLAAAEQAAPIADWHTTLRRPTPVGAGRPGHQVQRATGILTAHLHTLARLPATAVHPTGCEDPPEDMTGVDAIDHLTRLHGRARGILGRTSPRPWIPGDCPNTDCGARDADPAWADGGPLYRTTPRDFKDIPTVYCAACNTARSYTDYETYMTQFEWPAQVAA